MHNDEPVVDGGFGLPGRDGFEAVLEAEEQRARRHGGTHGLLLIELDLVPGDTVLAERAAMALARCLRETDLVARIDHRTFGVLALHCENLETVVARVRAALEKVAFGLVSSIDARSAGVHLQAAWTAVLTGGPVPAPPGPRHLPFVPSMPLCLN